MSFPERSSVEFVLTADERDQLVRWSQETLRLAVRARIVLRCAESDVVYARVADDLGVSAIGGRQGAQAIRGVTSGGLADTDRPGRPKTGLALNNVEREQLNAMGTPGEVLAGTGVAVKNRAGVRRGHVEQACRQPAGNLSIHGGPVAARAC